MMKITPLMLAKGFLILCHLHIVNAFFIPTPGGHISAIQTPRSSPILNSPTTVLIRKREEQKEQQVATTTTKLHLSRLGITAAFGAATICVRKSVQVVRQVSQSPTPVEERHNNQNYFPLLFLSC